MHTAQHTSGTANPDPYPPYINGTSADLWGIYPLNALGLVGIDGMLFTGELASGGVLVVVSVLVGLFLMVPCSLIQRYAFRDPWGLAIAKGMLLGLLTAIPTPLPSVITVALGVTGVVALRHRGEHSNVIDVHVN